MTASLSDTPAFNLQLDLVPELQRRDRHKRDRTPGALREKLCAAGLRLRETHPGARYRDLAFLPSAARLFAAE